jgi:hypothetical protein
MSNPLIKENAPATMNATIESLNVLTTLLDNTVELARIKEEDPKHQDEKQFSTIDVARLSLLAHCIKAALEHGFSQSLSESTAKAQAEPF